MPSLLELVARRQVRVIGDLQVLAGTPAEHSRRLLAAGFHSSCTLPMIHDDEFFGFIFCNSRERDYFTPAVLGQLEPARRLFALIVISELRTLGTATATVRYLTSRRDCETGAHLGRISPSPTASCQSLGY